MPEPKTRQAALPFWPAGPFAVAALIVLTLVGLYLFGWFTAAWVLTIFLIAFPVLYAIAAIAWVEISTRIRRHKRD